MAATCQNTLECFVQTIETIEDSESKRQNAMQPNQPAHIFRAGVIGYNVSSDFISTSLDVLSPSFLHGILFLFCKLTYDCHSVGVLVVVAAFIVVHCIEFASQPSCLPVVFIFPLWR